MEAPRGRRSPGAPAEVPGAAPGLRVRGRGAAAAALAAEQGDTGNIIL